MWGAEAELPPDAEAALQHSKRVGARLPLPQTGEGGCGVRKRSFRLMLKLRFSTPKGLARGSLSCKWARDYGVRKRSFCLMLKLRFSTPKGLATNAPTTAA